MSRQTFYTTSQGSHMMPYLWYKALRRLDADEPFGGDQLQRYGYLPNDKSAKNRKDCRSDSSSTETHRPVSSA